MIARGAKFAGKILVIAALATVGVMMTIVFLIAGLASNL